MATTERSLIGKNIIITGDISATEDLVIEGRVNGKIHLSESRLTVGEEGFAQSHISAREIVISGRVDGRMEATERIELRSTAKVTGDLVAPRLVVHQDAIIKGSVDLTPALSAKPQKPAKKETEEANESQAPRFEPAAVAAPQVAVAAQAYAS